MNKQAQATVTLDTINAMVNAGKLIKHHDALAIGYARVNTAKVESYKGRFGKGYKVHTNAPGTTRYHTVTYYTAA